MNIAYIRVSTVEQNEARQVEGLKQYGIDRWYTEKKSGKDANRPELQSMIDFAREGDTIYVHDFSRLARSTKDLLGIAEQLKSKGVHLVSHKESLDTSTATGKLMLTVIAAINEFERANLLERQREGIEEAKKRGVYKGRKEIRIEDSAWEDLYNQYKSRRINKKRFAEQLGVSRPTLDKLLRQREGTV